MKATKSLISMTALMLAAGLIMTFTACEKDKETAQRAVDDFFAEDYASQDRDSSPTAEDLAISPSSPSVDTVGEKIAFGVRGGRKPYSWSVADSSAGTVSPTSTKNDIEQVVYTCAALKKNTVICTDYLGRAATVDVSASGPNLTVTPASVKFLAVDLNNTSQSYTFSSSGGTTPISWSTDSPSLGAMTGSRWDSVATQAASVWSNSTVTVIATDSAGKTATATITFE